MAFCFNCGKQLPEGAAFCGSCGACQSTPGSAPQAQPAQGAATAVKAAKSGGSVMKWLLPLLAVVAAAAVAIYIFFGTNLLKSDEELIRERIQALEDAYNDGDYDGILDCMDAQTQAMMEATMGMMDGLMSEIGGMGFGMTDMFGFAGMLGDYCTIEIQNIEIDGDYATVSVVMSLNLYGMHESQEADLPMVKEDGDWYIGGMEGMIGSDYMNFLA